MLSHGEPADKMVQGTDLHLYPVSHTNFGGYAGLITVTTSAVVPLQSFGNQLLQLRDVAGYSFWIFANLIFAQVVDIGIVERVNMTGDIIGRRAASTEIGGITGPKPLVRLC